MKLLHYTAGPDQTLNPQATSSEFTLRFVLTPATTTAAAARCQRAKPHV
jgi:hypothetical protein